MSIRYCASKCGIFAAIVTSQTTLRRCMSYSHQARILCLERQIMLRLDPSITADFLASFRLNQDKDLTKKGLKLFSKQKISSCIWERVALFSRSVILLLEQIYFLFCYFQSLDKGKVYKPIRESQTDSSAIGSYKSPTDCRIENGKLFYDKRWYHTGHAVFLDHHKEGSRISGIVAAITEHEIWIRKTSDNARIRVFASQLHRGKCSIRKRPIQWDDFLQGAFEPNPTLTVDAAQRYFYCVNWAERFLSRWEEPKNERTIWNGTK